MLVFEIRDRDGGLIGWVFRESVAQAWVEISGGSYEPMTKERPAA